MGVSQQEFDSAYDAAIIGSVFVEYADYYRQSRSRFLQVFRKIEALGLPPGARAIDIGGGIMAVLINRLLGIEAVVGDVNERARPEIEALGLQFMIVNIFADDPLPAGPFDLVVLQEVIEHIPRPPYLVIERLKGMLRPGGVLCLTTPNGHRFRNLMYMALGREILDHYRYPGPNEALGHQHEYTMKQMVWQARASGMEILSADYYEDGFRGASRKARLGRLLARPTTLVPYWKNGLLLMLKAPA